VVLTLGMDLGEMYSCPSSGKGECQRHVDAEEQEFKRADGVLEEPRKVMAILQKQRKQVRIPCFLCFVQRLP